jgi:hypothetical protein
MGRLHRFWRWVQRVIFRKKFEVKPTGTVSMLPTTSAGIEPTFDRHYVRRYYGVLTEDGKKDGGDRGADHG